MNAVNLGNNIAENEQLEHNNPTTHGYNLQPRPVKPREVQPTTNRTTINIQGMY